MKKIILMVIAMVMTVGIAEMSAATKKTEVNVETTTFSASIDCDACVKKIMNYLPYQKGISDVEVDLPKKMVKVTYNSKKTSDASIIKMFKKIDVVAKVYVEPAPAKVVTPTPTQSTQSGAKTTTATANKR